MQVTEPTFPKAGAALAARLAILSCSPSHPATYRPLSSILPCLPLPSRPYRPPLGVSWGKLFWEFFVGRIGFESPILHGDSIVMHPSAGWPAHGDFEF